MEDNVLEIRLADRSQAKLMIGLAGQSGGGKTYSALQLAYGLANSDASQIGFLDTENRRGSLYADVFGDQKFWIGDLAAPFSPDRYVKAIRQFANKGVKVLVVDSITHEWEGEGGCDDIAQTNKTPKGMPNWLLAKREHKKFMNALLYTPMHVISCVRAREKTNFKDPRNIYSEGIQPITEKNVMFDMSMSILLTENGKKRENLKVCPDFLALIGEDGYLTPAHGKALDTWLGGKDPMELGRDNLRLAATKGTRELRLAWEEIPQNMRTPLNDFKNTLKDTAAAADKQIGPSVAWPEVGAPIE